MTSSTTDDQASTLHGDRTTQPSSAPGASAEKDGDGVRRARLPDWAHQSLHIFGLSGVAIAQPLFALLGENPTFFVAHRARPLDIALFAVAIVLLPAIALIVPVLVVGRISPRASVIATGVVMGLLATSVTTGVAEDMPARYFIPVCVLGTALGAWCYVRSRVVQLFALYLSPAPVLFVALFVFTSGVQPLMFGKDPEVLAASRADASVIVLVFDELPMGALLRADGSIDSDRFPGFSELAMMSTWYPHATTVASYTYWAVPAIMTGLLPNIEAPPVASQYPRSLFTMLGGSREVHVSEQVTSVCPRSVCEAHDDPSARRSLARDTALVGLHQLLPEDLGSQWLPSVSGSWTNFGEQLERAPVPDDDSDLDFAEWKERWHAGSGGAAVDFPAFLASLSGNSAGLWYQHEMIPHMGYRFLPDGRWYQGTRPRSLEEGWWAEDQLSTVNAQQRLLLQLQYADTHVTALLDRLREQGMIEDSLLVVMADHGINLSPGTQTRGAVAGDDAADGPTVNDAAILPHDAVLPIPLFISYPGQTTANVDERDAQSIDVLPTIADALDIDLPDDWAFDGRSLLTEPSESTRLGTWVHGADVEQVSPRPDAVRVARSMQEMFGAYQGAHDIYAVGPHRRMVGDAVGSIGPVVPSATVVNQDPAAFTNVDLEATSVPVLFTGEVTGIESGSWVALAVDDTIAGIGPVYRDHTGQAVIEIMIDPTLMRDGENDLHLYMVSPDTRALLPIATS